MTPQQEAMAVSLKEYFEVRLQSLDRATNTAAALMEKRLEGMNEFRNTLKDQANQFLTRNEFVMMMDKMTSEINALREFRVSVESKASQTSVIFVGVLSVIGVLIGVVGLFWKR